NSPSSSVMQFAGKRPFAAVCSAYSSDFLACVCDLFIVTPLAIPLLEVPSNDCCFAKYSATSGIAILLASILIAPVPYFSTQSATDSLRPVSASTSGFLTTIIGSWAGFSAVPHPEYFFASSVAGAVSNPSSAPYSPYL